MLIKRLDMIAFEADTSEEIKFNNEWMEIDILNRFTIDYDGVSIKDTSLLSYDKNEAMELNIQKHDIEVAAMDMRYNYDYAEELAEAIMSRAANEHAEGICHRCAKKTIHIYSNICIACWASNYIYIV